MSKQRYIVFLNGDSRMGASPDVKFCDESELKNLSLYAEYIDVYPIGERLDNAEKLKLGMAFRT